MDTLRCRCSSTCRTSAAASTPSSRRCVTCSKRLRKHGKAVWVLDRPNPVGRPVEGTAAAAGLGELRRRGRMPMRHGLTLGELAPLVRARARGSSVEYRVIEMQGWAARRRAGLSAGRSASAAWVNPSPNAPNLWMARCYPGHRDARRHDAVGRTRHDAAAGALRRARTRHQRICSTTMRSLAPQWLRGCRLRACWFEPTFHKHVGKLCAGVQIHVETPDYDHARFSRGACRLSRSRRCASCAPTTRSGATSPTSTKPAGSRSTSSTAGQACASGWMTQHPPQAISKRKLCGTNLHGARFARNSCFTRACPQAPGRHRSHATRTRHYQLSQALGGPLRHSAVPAHVARGDGRARLGQLRRHHRHRRRVRRSPELRHGHRRPRARGAGLPRRHHRAAGLAQRRAVRALGRPNLFFGITAGNMDSMVNRYTSDRRIRSDDAYTPGGEGGKRPDRSVIVYAQRAREAFKDVPIVIGGIEASLRRIAHFDYWSEKVRRSVLLDAKADLLVFGNAERQIVRDRASPGGGRAHRRDHRPARHGVHAHARRREAGSRSTRRTSIRRAASNPPIDPYAMDRPQRGRELRDRADATPRAKPAQSGREGRAVPRRVQECRPRAQRHPHAVVRAGAATTRCCTRTPRASCTSNRTPAMRARWCSGTATSTSGSTRRRIPLTTKEMDCVYELPYRARAASVLRRGEDPGLQDDPLLGRDPARLLRRLHVLLDHRARRPHHPEPLAKTRSCARSRQIRDTVPGFTGVISDLGGPTANMYRLACKSREIESACRRPSCVYPGICPNLNTDHSAADPAVPQGARAAGHQESADRLGRALRPRDRVARVREGAGAASRRRLSEDRARGDRAKGRCRR